MLVLCAYSACPTPAEPIEVRASRARRQQRFFHRDCYPLAWSEDSPRRGQRSGREALCAGCGVSLGYKAPSWFRQGRRFCRTCGWRMAHRTPRLAFLIRTCAFCNAPVERWPSEDAERVFCTRAHYAAFRRLRRGMLVNRGWIVCRKCGSRRPSRRSWQPASLDPATETYVCQRCRGVDHGRKCSLPGCRERLTRYQERYCSRAHHSAAQRGPRRRLRCEYTACRRPFEVTPFWAGRRRFCSRSCAARGKEVQRARHSCALCGTTLPRQTGRFCNQKCYTAWRRARLVPGARSIAARSNVLIAWERGVRGPRALAREAHASITTVYRVLKAEGKAVGSDPPALEEELERRRDAEHARRHPTEGSQVTYRGCPYTLTAWQADGRPVLNHASTEERSHAGLRVVVPLNHLRDVLPENGRSHRRRLSLRAAVPKSRP